MFAFQTEGGKEVAERDKFPWLKDEFDRLVSEGVLGDPHGEPGGAYLRVSSGGQAEEGRSGLPRQLEHIREKAIEIRLCIPWEHLFFEWILILFITVFAWKPGLRSSFSEWLLYRGVLSSGKTRSRYTSWLAVIS